MCGNDGSKLNGKFSKKLVKSGTNPSQTRECILVSDSIEWISSNSIDCIAGGDGDVASDGGGAGDSGAVAAAVTVDDDGAPIDDATDDAVDDDGATVAAAAVDDGVNNGDGAAVVVAVAVVVVAASAVVSITNFGAGGLDVNWILDCFILRFGYGCNPLHFFTCRCLFSWFKPDRSFFPQ